MTRRTRRLTALRVERAREGESKQLGRFSALRIGSPRNPKPSALRLRKGKRNLSPLARSPKGLNPLKVNASSSAGVTRSLTFAKL